MDEGNLAILVDAKIEYTNQLTDIISPSIFKGIKSIYENSKDICLNNNNNDILYQFQNDLSEIPKWNQEVINEHFDNLIKETKCDWLEDLLTAVFVSHTKILTSINFNKKKNKINLKIPKTDHFIHLCYIESARHFWKNPYLFDEYISKIEYQRNRRDSEKIINSTINETIRKQLPVKHILKEYLGNDFKDNISSELTEDHENLRKMVKAEIENCSNEKLSKLNINNLDLELDDTKPLGEEIKLDDTKPLGEEIKLDDTKPLGAAIKLDDNKPLGEEIKLDDIKPLGEEIKLDDNKPLGEEIKLDDIKPLGEEIHLDDIRPLGEEIHLDDIRPLGEEIHLDDIRPLEEEKDIQNVINKEVDNLKFDNDDGLKIETLNLDLDDDLSKLEEIYIDKPKEELSINKSTNDENEKIKTVYIDTKIDQKKDRKKKNTFLDTDIDVNYDSDSDDSLNKRQKYSKNDFSFFN